MENLVKIRSITNITHDVLQIVTDKPAQLQYNPGQAADISINRDGWRDEKRAFTFTSLPYNDFLEFTIKTYPQNNGVTKELLNLKADDELIVGDVFGDISYKGEGTFIAGGAGITPFLSIFRDLQLRDRLFNNLLIFANKTSHDIIQKDELKNLLGKNFINILSDEKTEEYAHGFISEDFLKKYSSDARGYYYLCGPPSMMDAVEKQLGNLGVQPERIIKEAF